MSQWTRKAIIESFNRFIAAKPLDKITVKDLVEDCGITRNTFYYYFTDVYALAAAVLRERLEALTAQFDPNDGWEDFLLLLARQLAGNTRMVRHLFRSSKSEEVVRTMTEILKLAMEQLFDYLAEGVAVNPKQRTLIIDFYRYALTGIAENWLLREPKEDPEALAHRISLLLQSGMRAAIRNEAESG